MVGSIFCRAALAISQVTPLEVDAIRAVCVDWLRDGSPATVCSEDCDADTRVDLGCPYSGHHGKGRVIGHCPGWLRTQPIWDEVRDYLDSGTTYSRDWPHKFLRVLRLAAAFRGERHDALSKAVKDGS